MMKDREENSHMETASVTDTEPCPSAPDTQAQASPIHGVLIGTLVELGDEGQAKVSYPGNLAVLPVAARSTAPLTAESVGREVALLFENGDVRRPIIVGVMQTSMATAGADLPEPTQDAQASDAETAPTTATLDESLKASDSELIIDGRRIDLQAREEIVLRCGKSSITMTRAGKVIIRGAYVSSKSSGANRIKGGSVQIN